MILIAISYYIIENKNLLQNVANYYLQSSDLSICMINPQITIFDIEGSSDFNILIERFC